jgi:hypothetical protein
MYQIIKINGTKVGITESVNYIKIHTNGCFVVTNKEDAIGVAYRGMTYNLVGHNDIIGAETVIISEIDLGYIFENYPTYDELANEYNKGVQNA